MVALLGGVNPPYIISTFLWSAAMGSTIEVQEKLTFNLADKPRTTELIESNVKFARKIAGKFYADFTKSGLDEDDIQSAAMWGLCNAAQKYNYDLDDGEFFQFYAKSRIIGAILDMIRYESDIVNRYYGVLITDPEEARSFSRKRQMPYTFLRSRKDIGRINSLLEMMNFSVDIGRTHDEVELLYCYQQAPEQNSIAEERGRAWEDILDCLSDKERNVLELHYFEGFQLEEIRQDYGVSSATVSRWHTAALDRLKKILDENLELLALIAEVEMS